MDTVNGIVTMPAQAIAATTVTQIDTTTVIGRQTFSFPVRALVGKCWVMCKYKNDPAPNATDIQNYGEIFTSSSPIIQLNISGENEIYIYCENAFTVYAQWGS